MDHKRSTRLGSQDRVLIDTPPDNGGFCGIRNGYKDEEMLEEMEMGKNPKECFIEMCKNRKMQDGLGS